MQNIHLGVFIGTLCVSFWLCVPVSTVCVYAVEGDVLVYGSWAPVY